MTRNIWIGILVVVVLVAGGWWYLNQSSVPTTSETSQLPTTQNTNTGTQAATNPAPVQQNAETANWKTYTNSAKGYEIRYPSDAIIDTRDIACIGIATKEFGTVRINAGNYDYCGTWNAPYPRLTDTVTIGGKQFAAEGMVDVEKNSSYLKLQFNSNISIVYGVEHIDKSNPNSWKDLGSLTEVQYQKALASAKAVAATLKVSSSQ